MLVKGGDAGVGGVSGWMGRTHVRVLGYQLPSMACRGPHITSKQEVRTRWHCMAPSILVSQKKGEFGGYKPCCHQLIVLVTLQLQSDRIEQTD